MDELKSGLGVELNQDLINKANEKNKTNIIKYDFYTEQLLQKYPEYFDAVYSQEVLYTILQENKRVKNPSKLKKETKSFAYTQNKIVPYFVKKALVLK